MSCRYNFRIGMRGTLVTRSRIFRVDQSAYHIPNYLLCSHSHGEHLGMYSISVEPYRQLLTRTNKVSPAEKEERRCKETLQTRLDVGLGNQSSGLIRMTVWKTITGSPNSLELKVTLY